MCYSLAVRQDHEAFRRLFPRSRMAIKEFFNLYWRRKKRPKPLLRTPRVLDEVFAKPTTDDEREILALIEATNAEQTALIEKDLFAQRKRLADAERALQTKVTKKAENDVRVAGNKIADGVVKLDRMRRTQLRESDARIFPGTWCAVLMIEDGEPIIRPMRYLCRPPGKPASYDVRFGAAYNGRADNLRSTFWRDVYGHNHGVLIASAFFENVSRHAAEQRALRPGEEPENIVLRFSTEPQQDLLIACLVSYWTPPPGSDEEPFWSFAAVTDEPLPEVAAAGHDRTVVALKPENVEAWLTPQGRSLAELDQLLQDKQRPHYHHELAKAA